MGNDSTLDDAQSAAIPILDDGMNKAVTYIGQYLWVIFCDTAVCMIDGAGHINPAITHISILVQQAIYSSVRLFA